MLVFQCSSLHARWYRRCVCVEDSKAARDRRAQRRNSQCSTPMTGGGARSRTWRSLMTHERCVCHCVASCVLKLAASASGERHMRNPRPACRKVALLLYEASVTSFPLCRWSRHYRASTRPVSAQTTSRALQVHRPPQPAQTAGPRPSPWLPDQTAAHCTVLTCQTPQFCMPVAHNGFQQPGPARSA